MLIRGAFKSDFWKNLGFCPNQVDPLPPPRKLGHPKLKKKNDVFFCILGYSKHIIFSWKSHIFGDFVGWDWGTPAILQQNPNKSTLGKIG